MSELIKMNEYLPNESSCAKETTNWYIFAVPSNGTAQDLELIHIVQGDCGNFKVFECHILDGNSLILISMDA